LNLTVVIEFGAFDRLVRLFNFLLRLLEFVDMGEQGGEGVVELVEWGIHDGIGIDLLDYALEAFEQLDMQVEAESVEIAPLAILVGLSELGFIGTPFFEGSGGDVELF